MTAAIRQPCRTRFPGGGSQTLRRAVATHGGDAGE
jgi:hypothetical protein